MVGSQFLGIAAIDARDVDPEQYLYIYDVGAEGGPDAFVVRPYTAFARFLAQIFDPWVIDGIVNGVAALARGLSWVSRGLQTGNVQHYVAGFLIGTLALLAYYIGQL